MLSHGNTAQLPSGCQNRTCLLQSCTFDGAGLLGSVFPLLMVSVLWELRGPPHTHKGLHSFICFYRLLAVGSECLVLSSENRLFKESPGSPVPLELGQLPVGCASPCHSAPDSLSLQPTGPGQSTATALVGGGWEVLSQHPGTKEGGREVPVQSRPDGSPLGTAD